MKKMLLMLLCMMSIAMSNAQEIFYEYNDANHTATLSWINGEIPNLEIPAYVINPDNGEQYSVIGFPNYFFNYCNHGIETIVIPSTVENISEGAFSECKNLREVTLSLGLKSIDSFAFLNCSKLSNITLPSMDIQIADYAFGGCLFETSFTQYKDMPGYPWGAVINEYVGDFYIGSDSILINYMGTDERVVVPEKVKVIGKNAFSGKDFIKEIVLPDGLHTIEESAFSNCSQLSKINIPQSVTYIDERYSIFDRCTSLPVYDNVRYADTYLVEVIDGWQLDEVKIKEGTRFIGMMGLFDCSFHSITIPEGVESMAQIAILNNWSLQEITLPQSLKRFYNSIAGCGNLRELFIPAGVTYFDMSETYGNSSLNKIRVADGNKIYDSRDNCNAVILTKENRLVYATPKSFIPETVTTISVGAMTHIETMYEIVIPKSVKKIEWKSLPTGMLSSIVCESEVPPTIDYQPGHSGKSIPVYVPDAAVSAYQAADMWNSFYEILPMSKRPQPVINYTSTDGKIVTPTTTQFGDATLIGNTYENGVGTLVFDMTPTVLPYRAFADCKTLKTIDLPRTISKLNMAAFDNCYGLESFQIPERVTELPHYLFSNCRSLRSLYIPKGVHTISYGITAGCSSLEKITVDPENEYYNSNNNCNAIIGWGTTLMCGCKNTIIPEGIQSIYPEAFSNIETLTTISLPKTIINIGFGAFQETGIEEIVIPNSVESIDSHAFYSCKKLRKVSLPTLKENLNISDMAFNDTYLDSSFNQYASYPDFPWSATIITEPIVDGMIIRDSLLVKYVGEAERLEVPAQIKVIGQLAFYKSQSLKEVVLPEGLTTIESGAFNMCSSLEKINIPSSVTTAEDAFSSCESLPVYDNVRYADCCLSGVVDKNLTTYTVREGTRFIGCYAFKDCKNLETIKLPSSVEAIGGQAFEDCEKLRSINIPEAVNRVGGSLFYGCNSLPVINNVRYADTYMADIADKNLTECNIEPGTRFVEMNAFQNCPELTSIYIPKQTTQLLGYPMYIFYNCPKLTTIEIEEGNSVYDSRENCNAIILTKSNTLWRACAASTIPSSIETIGEEAFYNILHPVVDIPEGVKHIQQRAFGISIDSSEEDKMMKLILPSTLETISELHRPLWSGFLSLSEIVCKAVTPPTVVNHTVILDPTIPVYVPAGSIEAYKAAAVWSEFTNYIAIPAEATELPSDEVITESTETSIVISWPEVEEAETYTVSIMNGETLICTITFNAAGEVIQTEYPNASNSPRKAMQQAEMATATTTGWQYTIGGLEAGKQYTYRVLAMNSDSEPIRTFEGSVSTKTPTGMQNANEQTISKYVRNGQLFILRDGKVYNAQGQRMK